MSSRRADGSSAATGNRTSAVVKIPGCWHTWAYILDPYMRVGRALRKVTRLTLQVFVCVCVYVTSMHDYEHQISTDSNRRALIRFIFCPRWHFFQYSPRAYKNSTNKRIFSPAVLLSPLGGVAYDWKWAWSGDRSGRPVGGSAVVPDTAVANTWRCESPTTGKSCDEMIDSWHT